MSVKDERRGQVVDIESESASLTSFLPFQGGSNNNGKNSSGGSGAALPNFHYSNGARSSVSTGSDLFQEVRRQRRDAESSASAAAAAAAKPSSPATGAEYPREWFDMGISPRPVTRTYLVTKRCIDIVGALLLIAALSVIWIPVALLIFLEDRGPILFSQMRVGRDGRQFRFYKFRSMVRNAEALKKELMAHNEAGDAIFKMKDDPRITRIGRWIRRYSIDEMPQFINVLRGEMSLVGPRPHLPCEVAQYTERQKNRLTVQPGLMCVREACGRSKISFERWIEMDLLYIQYRSPMTDLRIILRAIPAVIKGEGAY